MHDENGRRNVDAISGDGVDARRHVLSAPPACFLVILWALSIFSRAGTVDTHLPPTITKRVVLLDDSDLFTGRELEFIAMFGDERVNSGYDEHCPGRDQGCGNLLVPSRGEDGREGRIRVT